MRFFPNELDFRLRILLEAWVVIVIPRLRGRPTGARNAVAGGGGGTGLAAGQSSPSCQYLRGPEALFESCTVPRLRGHQAEYLGAETYIPGAQT